MDEIFLDGVPGQTQPSSNNTVITVIMDDITKRTDVRPGQVYIRADTGALISGGMYTHRASGNITDFTPTTGRQGSRITITGNRLLGYGESIMSVSVAGVVSTIENASSEVVVVRAGDGTENMTGPIELTINTGATVSSIAARRNFTYGRPGRITNVSPSFGSEGSGVVISGVALISMTTGISVTFGGSPVSRIITSSLTQVSVVVGPAPASGNSSAEIVITSGDESFVGGATFSFLDLPLAVVGLSQGQEGTRITILLPRAPTFTASTSLRASIDDQKADIVSANVSAGTIVVSVPRARRPGSYVVDIAVENIINEVSRLRDGFTYLPEGAIYFVIPNIGQRGTTVVLMGDNLLGGGNNITTAVVRVMDNEVAAQVLSTPTDTLVELRISGNLPETSVSLYPVAGDIILTADTSAIVRRLEGFSFVEPGRITNVTPQNGLHGARVTINGTHLLQQTSQPSIIDSVMLAGVTAEVLSSESGFSNATDESILVRAAPSSGNTSGPVEITLTTGAIITSDSLLFSYSQPASIALVSPSQGTVGTNVQIFGTNLLLNSSSIAVHLGGVMATVNMATNTIVSVTARKGEPGVLGSVRIEADTGAYLVLENQWTYEALGNITAVSPPIGQRGVPVTITGENLLGSAGAITVCSLAGVEGVVNQSTNSRVMCIAGDPSNCSELVGPVTITADSGFEIRTDPIATNISFTYYPAYIDSINPTNGSNGTIVRINGFNLFSAPNGDDVVSEVRFGNTPASVVEISRDQLMVRVGAFAGESTADNILITSSSGALVELASAWNYTQPGEILAVAPSVATPGTNVTVTGNNLVPPCVPEVQVIVGQSLSYTATVLNTSAVEFRPGVYQNLDSPNVRLPMQVVSGSGATVYTETVQFEYSPVGNVTNIAPRAGSRGTLVNITGTDLIGGGNIRLVTVAGVPAVVVNASDTEVIMRAGLGPMSGGSGSIVIEADSGHLTGLGGNAWTYLPNLTSADVTPNSGQNGTIVTVDLSNLPPNFTVEFVSLSNVPTGDIQLSTSGTLTVVAGPSTQTNLSSVEIQFGGNISLTIPDSWTYRPAATVTSINPSTGYFNTQVSIVGNNFQTGGTMVREVYLAGLRTAIMSQTNQQVNVILSQFVNSSTGAITGGLLMVLNDTSMFSSTSALSFTYVQHRVDSVTPDFGTRGTIVTIRGIGLLAGGNSINSNSFHLGGVPAYVVMRSDNMIIVQASASAATDTGNITYTVDTGAEVLIPDSWRYIAPGEIAGIFPHQGRSGTLVTITGNRMFGGGTRATEVLFGSVMVSEAILINTESLIQVRAGESSSALSPAAVTVISDTGAMIVSNSSLVSFQYQTPGTVSAVDPAYGQVGTRITITGTNLYTSGDRIVRVTLAGIEATRINTTSNSSITVQAVRPSQLGMFSGNVAVETESGATAVSTANFTYLSEGQILSVTPARGQVETIVRIRGERLRGGGDNVSRVLLAGVEANITSENNTEVVIRANPSSGNAEVTGDVVLIAESGAVVQRLQGWTYVEPGTITSISPSVGQYGTRVTIVGDRLLSGGSAVSQILIGGFAATDITGGENETSVSARIGNISNPFPFSTGSITILAIEGGRLESSIPFQYLGQSVIANVSPSSGVGNTSVTIMGTNLLGGGSTITSITVAGIAARSINESGDSNNTAVSFVTGFNPDGERLVGNIEIESDTGARTISLDAWTYIQECPAGQYGTVGNCSNCSEQCSLCFGPGDTDCYECRDFSIMSPGMPMRCVSQCPSVATLDNVCVNACASNQYAQVNTLRNATFCLDCHELCDPNLRCSGPNAFECGDCRFVYDNQTGFCVESCPVATFNDTGICRPCSEQCEAAAGCSGPAATECVRCANFAISSFLVDTMVTADVCVESCPSLYYVDTSTRFCQPCSGECLDGCEGPTAFHCNNCRNFSIRYNNGTTKCVAACNPDSSRLTMYDDMNGVCLPCSPPCSLVGGCRGPSPSECNGCRTYADTGMPFPTLNGSCVEQCPTAYYNNTNINQCAGCNAESCPNGPCVGPRPEDCRSGGRGNPFAAGAGTIAIVVIIILLLVAILITIVIVFFVFKCRSGGFKVLQPDQAIELGEQSQRYAKAPTLETKFSKGKSAGKTEKEKAVEPQKGAPAGVYNAAFQDEDEYTDVTTKVEVVEVYAEMGEGQEPAMPLKSPVTASQELYQDMEPAPMDRSASEVPPERPPKPATEAKTTELSPTALSKTSKLPPPDPDRPPRPPPPSEPEQEEYADMQGGVQEVYVNPAAGDQEQYSEVVPAANLEPASQDEFYDDTGSVLQAKTSTMTRNASSSDQTPLISAEENTPKADDDVVVYEDTDAAIAAVEQYRKTSASCISSADVPPALPHRPTLLGKKSLSSPLPLTPLEQSLKNQPPPRQGLPPPQEQDEALYSETLPETEILYEAVPTRQTESAELLPSTQTSSPSKQQPPPPSGKRKGSKQDSTQPPLPPKGKKK